MGAASTPALGCARVVSRANKAKARERAYLAAAEADGHDAQFIASGEEFGLLGWCGRHGVWECEGATSTLGESKGEDAVGRRLARLLQPSKEREWGQIPKASQTGFLASRPFLSAQAGS